MGLRHIDKRNLISLLILFWTAYHASDATGQLIFKQLSTAEGLPANMIHQVVQDDTGFIWIASDYGLYRYDGYVFRPFKSDMHHPQLLPSNVVTALTTDRQGRLWIGTQEGLACMELHTGRVHTYGLGRYDNKRISTLLVSRKGAIYSGTFRCFAMYDEAGDSVKILKDSINATSLIEDPIGDILVGTLGNGLYRYRPANGNWIHYSSIAGQDTIRSICQTPDGTVYFGTNTGLYKASFNRQGNLESSEIVSRSEPVYAIRWDNDRKHLFLGLRGGVRYVDETGKISDYILRCKVRSIYPDRDGKSWIATAGEGLYIEERLSHHFTTLHEGRLINAVIATPGDNLWTAFDTGLDFNGNSMLDNKHIFDLAYSHTSGSIYICTWDNGLYEAADGNLRKHFTSATCGFLNQSTVRGVLEDSHGRLWTATYRGLGVRYADGREYCFANIKDMNEPIRMEILELAEDSDGSLWILTPDKGILHLYGNLDNPLQTVCTVYDSHNGGLPVNRPICIHPGLDGCLWVGTDGGGLCLFDRDKNRFISVHRRWHLPGDMVMSIEELTPGCLWIGTNSGLAYLTAKGEKQGNLRVFTTADGLPDNFFMPRASCTSGDTLWFGTSRGVIRFSPRQEDNRRKGHQIAVTAIRIDGEETNGHDSILVVSPHSRSFQVEFSSLTYSGQHQNVYAYRLDGYDHGWQHTPSSDRTATYSNLPPGEYTLLMSATDENGDWNEPLSLPVRVLPPFWRTYWAYMAYVLGAISLSWYAIRHTRRRMMTRNRLNLEITDDGNSCVVIRHEGTGNNTESLTEKKRLAFELKDLNYTDADEEFLRRCIDIVNRHLSDSDFCVGKMVDELSTSRTTLFNRLKTLTGMSANSFITDIRLKAACRIMDERHNSIRIAELAYAVGFNDARYFSQSFKKKFGLNPKEYLERVHDQG